MDSLPGFDSGDNSMLGLKKKVTAEDQVGRTHS
jgi:hypothetical protein